MEPFAIIFLLIVDRVDIKCLVANNIDRVLTLNSMENLKQFS